MVFPIRCNVKMEKNNLIARSAEKNNAIAPSAKKKFLLLNFPEKNSFFQYKNPLPPLVYKWVAPKSISHITESTSHITIKVDLNCFAIHKSLVIYVSEIKNYYYMIRPKYFYTDQLIYWSWCCQTEQEHHLRLSDTHCSSVVPHC